MEFEEQRRMYALHIGDPSHATITSIGTSHNGTTVQVPSHPLPPEHPRLLVGSILDGSVVTISPQITTHTLQQPIHHVIHQHPSQQTELHQQHQQQTHQQQHMHSHFHIMQQQQNSLQGGRIEVEPAIHVIPETPMENRVLIDSNNMIVGVGLVGEVLQGEDDSGTPADDNRCFVCNETLCGDNRAIINAETTIMTASRRKLSDMLTRLVGSSICRVLGTDMCHQCFCLVEKVDALEIELANAKIEVIKKCESTLQSRQPGNKLPITSPSQPDEGQDTEEANDESPFEDAADDPNDPDVTPASLNQSRKKKGRRKALMKKKGNSTLAAFVKTQTLKNSSGSTKRGRGRPRKQDKLDTCPPAGSVTQMCPCCQKIVEASKYLRHLGMHKVFPCPFCSAVYKRKDIKNHIAEAHQEEPQFPCSGCDLTFDTFSRLRRHCTSVHMGIELERAKCPLCDKTFSSANGLKVHVETIHENSQMFQCPICKESFNQRGNMKNHYRRVHEGEQARKLQCDTCNKGFICPSDLRKHVERVHLKIKKNEVLCRVCSKSFSDQRALKVHMNAVHTKEVKFPCPECKMVFHSLTNMVTHRRRMHGGNGGRKHICEICTKAFCSPSDLRTHIKVVHENVRKYVCDICGQGFKVGSHLKYHRRRHTGETPYKCPHCSKCFHGPSHISDHVKKVHKTVYMGINQRRRLNLPEHAPPPPPGILPSRDSKAKFTLTEPPQPPPPANHSQVIVPPSVQSQQLPSASISTMQHIPQHILPFGGQSGHMISAPAMMDQHMVHHNHYTNIQFDQTNTQSPMPMVVRFLHDMQSIC